MEFSYQEVSQIVKASKEEVTNNRKYQLFLKRFLQNTWDKLVNHQILFAVSVAPDDMATMQFENLQEKLDCVIKHLGEFNFFIIDNEGSIIESQFLEGSSKEIIETLECCSIDKYVFFFGEQGITQFCNGRILEENNFFYSRRDRMRYIEKKDISQIKEVMDNYERQFVTQQVNYMCFFADNSTLNRIDSNLIRRNILKNRPEHYMRDQLCQYLTDHMRYTFTIEPELGQTKRELDIYFDVSGELYFIEIKWLGVSVNESGTALSTTYTDSRVREGVTQSLEYIEELLNTSEKSLRHGYLVVYDARDSKTNINFNNYIFVEARLRPCLDYFSVLKIVSLEKRHPA